MMDNIIDHVISLENVLVLFLHIGSRAFRATEKAARWPSKLCNAVNKP